MWLAIRQLHEKEMNEERKMEGRECYKGKQGQEAIKSHLWVAVARLSLLTPREEYGISEKPMGPNISLSWVSATKNIQHWAWPSIHIYENGESQWNVQEGCFSLAPITTAFSLPD